MTKSLTTLLLTAALFGLVALPASAQTLATRTTLAADASATDLFITVTSGTGFTVGNEVWVNFEQMRITSVSGAVIGVRRGQNGTAAQAHDNTDGVITGTGTGGYNGQGHFHTNDPDLGQDCTRGSGQASHSPWINVRTGWISICDNGITADWSQTRKFQQTTNSEPTSF